MKKKKKKKKGKHPSIARLRPQIDRANARARRSGGLSLDRAKTSLPRHGGSLSEVNLVADLVTVINPDRYSAAAAARRLTSADNCHRRTRRSLIAPPSCQRLKGKEGNAPENSKVRRPKFREGRVSDDERSWTKGKHSGGYLSACDDTITCG